MLPGTSSTPTLKMVFAMVSLSESSTPPLSMATVLLSRFKSRKPPRERVEPDDANHVHAQEHAHNVTRENVPTEIEDDLRNLVPRRPLDIQANAVSGVGEIRRWWCISTVNTLPVHGFDALCVVGKKTPSSLGFTPTCSTRPASISPTPLIL